MKTKNYFLTCLTYFSGSRMTGAFAVIIFVLLLMNSITYARVVSTEYTNLDGGTADFGSGFHIGGAPLGSGVVTFDYDTSSGQLVATGRVRGTLYWDALFSSGCARLTILFRDVNNGPLTARNIDRCGPGGDANNSANKLDIDESFSSPLLTRISVLTRELRGGVLIGGASDTFFAPLSKRYYTIIKGGSAHLGFFLPYILFDLPIDPAEIAFDRNNGLMGIAVSGDLYSGNAVGECARIIVDFRNTNAAVLSSRTRDTCNSRAIAETFESGSLSQIRLRVGDLLFGNFRNVTSTTFDFNGQTGNFEVQPADAAAVVNEPINYAFSWTVPEPLNWHDLGVLDLLIRDDVGTVLLLRFDEASNTFSLFNERSGKFGPAFPVGSPAQLQTSKATFYLSDASVTPINSVLGSGPDSPTVMLNLPISFKPSAAGRTYSVFVAASDDLGNDDPFAFAGTLTVTK